MTRAEIIYLLPYLGSLALSLGVLFYASQRHQTKGVPAYLLYVSGQTMWILGFIIEVIIPSLGGKLLWDSIQYLASVIVLLAFPVFAVQYTEYPLKNPRRLFILSLIIPGLFTRLW